MRKPYIIRIGKRPIPAQSRKGAGAPPYGFSWRVLCLYLLLILGTELPSSRQGNSQTVKEYDLKAVFLYNFLQFVEWPSSTFPTSQSPFVIGVWGGNPFGKTLEEVVQGEIVRNRNIVVTYPTRLNQVEQCHVLYINAAAQDTCEEVLAQVRDKPVLTVGETNNFIQQGGMVQFFIQEEKLRLRIHLKTAQTARLKLSSRLLRVSEVMDQEG